ncbi:lactate/malate dehydrogenase family protein [Metallosphaera cuprina]|uniref:Malate dehydrogenase n=1 Tax=Metallosphaera cuprina (strain Ar-4) TaxID=1006006 RepID=F4FZX3_METCR|nr:lactate/malate dehydrogenase family protein [Metallosphaera cuprina]AEB95735.1 malate dehydrogenase(NAD+) [Metallosphaera cuprina Ar-4]
MAKVGFIGAGKIGQTIAYSAMVSGAVDEAVIYDIIPELPEKYEHELRHAFATRGIKLEVLGTNSLDDVSGMDIIVISAGKPRKPGMSRRDLFVDNAKIMIDLGNKLPAKNPGAIYLMVANPVDMMASVFMKYSKQFTISAGDQVETMRMRSFIAKKLKLPVSAVDGFVGGEHGEDAVVLWSTVKIKGQPVDKYNVNKDEVTDYVKKIPGEIIRVIGGTTWGPGTIIADIIKAFALNENRVMSIATPREYEKEIIHVSAPTVVGSSIGPSLETLLDEKDRWSLNASMKDFYEVYKDNLKQLEQTMKA